jgi:hypothetical protein
MQKEMDKEKCQSIYWNLMNVVDVRDGGVATLLVNELKHTARCDHIHNLELLRAGIQKEMTAESLARVIEGTENAADERRAERAVYHYFPQAQTEVYSCLEWKSKMYYHTFYRWEKWVAGFTIGGTAGGGLFKMAKTIGERRRASRSNRSQ